MTAKTAKWLSIGAAVLVLLLAAGIIAFQIAVRTLKADVIRALGPESEVADLRVGWTSVVITGVRVKAPRGWPAERTLSAERVVVMPDLRQLLSRRIYVNSVTVENGYISAVRPKEGGGVKVLPTMLAEHKKQQAQRDGRAAEIATVELSNCIVELFDATLVGHKKMRVDAVQGSIKDVKLPKLDSRLTLDLRGIIKGPVHQGTMVVTGWIDVAGKRSELATHVRNVDLGLFEPYIVKKVKSEIDEGTFNLDFKSTVRNNVVNASGTLLLVGLKLKTGSGPLGGFSSLPQRAVLGALEKKDDTVTLDFLLKGDLDNPAFSLSQGLGLRTAAALLKGLGLGFEGLVRAIFVLVSGLGSAFTPL